MNKKLKVFIVIVVVLFTIIILTSLSSPEEAAQKAREQANINYSGDKVDIINNTIDGIGDFEVTVWDSNGNLISEENSNYPYEIIVNASYNSSVDCLYAKKYLRDVAYNIYSNSLLKGKVGRILFTVPYVLRSSVGYNDFKDFTESSWNNMGPSILWSTILQYASYENESGSFTNRTWGVSIDSSCK